METCVTCKKPVPGKRTLFFYYGNGVQCPDCYNKKPAGFPTEAKNVRKYSYVSAENLSLGLHGWRVGEYRLEFPQGTKVFVDWTINTVYVWDA